jgi:hypothetical protein
MTLDLEDELRGALRAYRAALPAPPDLAGPAARGGTRRQWRRRAALVAVPAVLVAAVVVAPRWAYSPPDYTSAAASLPAAEQALLTGRTGGDLAGDPAYLAAAARAWTDQHDRSDNADRGIFDHLLGRPTVTWAGTTPAGPAAVVVQLADLREHENVQLTRAGVALLWGFVGPGPGGGPTLVSTAYPVPGAPDVEAAWIGADRRTLVVVDRGNTGEQVSWGLEYDGAAGSVRRSWRPVRFDDGAAVLTAPAGTNPAGTVVKFRGDAAEIGNQGPAPEEVDPRLRWRGSGDGWLTLPVGPDPAAAWGGRLPDGDAAEGALYADLGDRLLSSYPDVTTVAHSPWYAVGRTPDGRRLVAGETWFAPDPSHVYAALRGPAGVEAVSAAVHADRPVPVDLTLPDGQGRLVAAYGKTFTWSGGGTARDAALVPAGATDLRVDGTPVQ